MKVRFARTVDALVETDKANATGLPTAVISSARLKLQWIKAATDERDLRNRKSLNFKKLKGSDDTYSIRLNDQYRMHLKLDGTCDPKEVTILLIGDPH